MKFRLVFPALGVALALAGAARAQGADPEEGDATARVGTMPDWSIRTEVDRLDTSMREYNSLINSLSRASDDLGKEFQEYLKDPNNRVLASSVERKMALYAKTVMADFDAIIADQDVLGANFRELQRKLVAFSGHLGTQAKGYKARLDDYSGKARDIEKELVEMSIQIRENPPADPAELRALKNKFALEFRRYQLQARYVNGYKRQYKSYQDLEKSMKSLAGLFVNLHEKFNELIQNLENERTYLDDSIRLQLDKIRIQQIIAQGVLGSEQAIGNVAEKLANLYNKVDAFARVHERINGDLSNFVQSQGVLMDVTRKINAIGAGTGEMGDLANDMDRAIDAFYRLRNEGEPEELVLDQVRKEVEQQGKAQLPAGEPVVPPTPATPGSSTTPVVPPAGGE